MQFKILAFVFVFVATIQYCMHVLMKNEELYSSCYILNIRYTVKVQGSRF